MAYKVRYYSSVLQTLEEIKRYIITQFGAKQSAQKKVQEIMTKLSALEIFPEVGFDADERFGKALDKRYKTRGLPIGKDYIALYFVNHDKKEVMVTHLLPTKSDYVKLFK